MITLRFLATGEKKVIINAVIFPLVTLLIFFTEDSTALAGTK